MDTDCEVVVGEDSEDDAVTVASDEVDGALLGADVCDVAGGADELSAAGVDADEGLSAGGEVATGSEAEPGVDVGGEDAEVGADGSVKEGEVTLCVGMETLGGASVAGGEAFGGEVMLVGSPIGSGMLEGLEKPGVVAGDGGEGCCGLESPLGRSTVGDEL